MIDDNNIIGSSFVNVDQWFRDAPPRHPPAALGVEEDPGDADEEARPDPDPEEGMCRTCLWFAHVPDADEGECRAEPPKADYRWPKVKPWGWCREWELAP